MPEQLFQQSIQAWRAGERASALSTMQRFVAANPENIEGLINLGAMLRASGQQNEAIRHLRRAAELSNRPEAWFNLGNAEAAAGNVDRAAECFASSLKANSAFAAGALNWANVLNQAGRIREAHEIISRYFHLLDKIAKAWRLRGKLEEALGMEDSALESYRRTKALDPSLVIESPLYQRPAAAQRPLAELLDQAYQYFKEKQFAEAGDLVAEILRREPTHLDAHMISGAIQVEKSNPSAAIETFSNLLAQHPDNATLLSNLGWAYNQANQSDEALPVLRKAVKLDPALDQAVINLTFALNKKDLYSESADVLGQLLQVKADHKDAMLNYTNALTNCGELKKANEVNYRNLEHHPEQIQLIGNHLFALSYRSDLPESEVAAEHFRMGERFHRWAEQQQLDLAPLADLPSSGERIRVGYLSPDYRTHSVALFIRGLFEFHNKDDFEIILYHDSHYDDEMTKELRGYGHHWEHVRPLKDETLAEKIRSDRVHILADLGGHSAGNRMAALALRLAPIQLTYLGYPATSGIRQMDFFLTDKTADPPGAHDEHFSEKLFRLDGAFLNYRPQELPPVSQAPWEKNGYVTFGSFNKIAKYTPEVLNLWARLLKEIPDARLQLKASAFNESATRQRFLLFFEQASVENRVDFTDWDPHMDSVDVTLDPFPYNGATTTCQALWMGLPVITKSGHCHRARVTTALLHHIGLPELCAANEEEYLAIARRLNESRNRISELRATMRERMQNSPLMDDRRFARRIEAAYREMVSDKKK